MREIKALTSVRGIAAMMVVLQHFSTTAQHHAADDIPSLVPHGYMAVNLFFVLSGFIMAYTYHRDFDLRGLRAMPSFLLKRAARILPLNTVVVVGIVLAGLVSQFVTGRNIFYTSSNILYDAVCNLLLVQAFGLGTNLNGPSWSICTEFAAYLLFPLLLACAFARRIVSAAVSIAAMGTLIVTAIQHPHFGLDVATIGGELALCFSQFVLGLFTYRAARNPRVAAILRGDWPAILAAGWIAACLLLRLDLPAAMAFPAMVAALACNDGSVGRRLSTPVLYFLGEISFSIYLIHDPLRPLALAILRAVHPALLGMVPALGFALAGSLLVIPLAFVGYVAVERPGRQIVRGLAALFVRPAVS